MSRSIGCCLMVAGVGFVAGAMLASNNAEVRKWFTSTSKKLSDMYDDIMQKMNSSSLKETKNSLSGEDESVSKNNSNNTKHGH